jgi:hypothetical protein
LQNQDENPIYLMLLCTFLDSASLCRLSRLWLHPLSTQILLACTWVMTNPESQTAEVLHVELLPKYKIVDPRPGH